MSDQSKHGIEYHSHDQRKHYRLTTPFWVQVDGKTYKTKNWSVGGLSIAKYHKKMMPGQTLALKIVIKFQGFNIGFDAQGKVVDVDSQNNLRLEFCNLSARSKNILQFFSQSIISGEMADIEDTIKRIDVPINQQEEKIKENQGKRPPLSRWPLKSLIFSALYLIIGLLIFLYIALIVYSNFVHMKIESAVVSAPIETVVSPFNGNIGEYYVKAGSKVVPEQPLVRIQDHEIEHELHLEQTNLLAAKNDHGLQTKFLNGEKNKMDIYRNIGETKYNEALSNVREYTERLEHLKNNHERAKILYSKKFIAKADMDKYEADFETVMHQLDEAKHQLEVHSKALKSIETGHYFSADQLEGELPQQQAHLEHAENQVEVIKHKIKAHEEQIRRRIIKAPFNGHVVKVFRSDTNTVDRGDNLLLLEKDQARGITAFLTQDEVVEISLDTTVTVYIPAIRQRFTGKVKHIDRTDGFISEVNAEFRPRTINDRSALVQVELDNFDIDKGRELLHPGTPAVVYFDRSILKAITHRIKLYFTPTSA